MRLSPCDFQVKNPKQKKSVVNTEDAWYPFYAGFSYEFAYDLIRSAGLSNRSRVLDPWNGAGTTTAAAAAAGKRSVGIDLNPVMVVTAKARLLSADYKPSLRPIGHDICRRALSEDDVATSANDPLNDWFDVETASTVRSLERAVNRLLVDDTFSSWPQDGSPEALSTIAAFFYLVLFRAVRCLLYARLSSNPTWVKKPKSNEEKCTLDSQDVLACFKAELRALISGVELQPYKFRSPTDEPSILLGDSRSIHIQNGSVDLIVTSPPYCTRIDYAKATMPELALLGHETEGTFRRLRERLIGTAVIEAAQPVPSKVWGSTCNDFLERVAKHPSKASKTYYLKNHLQYFGSMHLSLKQIGRVLRQGGACILVVQTSFYKEVYNDLPTILAEMGESAGLELIRRDDFETSRSMANLNTRAKVYRSTSSTTESVLCFQHIKGLTKEKLNGTKTKSAD